jgi:molybdenum cofactor cytidylyltransferase
MPRHAVILAAGASDRMGRDKAGLPWLDGELLLPWLMKTLEATGWTPIAVVSPRTESFWRERLPETRVHLNPHPERGKTTSIAAGLQALAKKPGPVLITAIDQPRPAELYRQLAVADRDAVLIPDNGGRRGHPIVLPNRLRGELNALDEESLGLRGFLERHRAETTIIPCPVDWQRWDFNTPGAYEEALEWFRNHIP